MRDGHQPRPVLLNNWEATGFNYDFNRLAGLFAPAKEIGTELFLLDDGWFGNTYPRVNDDAGLGDWQANRKRFPNGLAPLAADAVKDGLRFGIWMEPEMVNPNSVLFHKHPNWIICQPKRPLELQRNQLVLDLTRPTVQTFEWDSIKSILSTPDITYAKWDCNRYLTQPGSSCLAPDRQSELWIWTRTTESRRGSKSAARKPRWLSGIPYGRLWLVYRLLGQVAEQLAKGGRGSEDGTGDDLFYCSPKRIAVFQLDVGAHGGYPCVACYTSRGVHATRIV